MDLANLAGLMVSAGLIGTALIAGLSYGSRKVLREANKDLKEANQDLKVRIDELEKDVAKLSAEKSAEIAELKSRNEVLTSMVTGEVHWRALAEAQDQLIRDAHKHWNVESESLEQVLDCLNTVIDKLNKATP
jgi:C4-dicarboxylate-specific signal transduction histidine kinase